MATWCGAADSGSTTTAASYFSYLSQPAGSGNGGPFGVTESAPLASYVVGNGTSLENPMEKITPDR